MQSRPAAGRAFVDTSGDSAIKTFDAFGFLASSPVRYENYISIPLKAVASSAETRTWLIVLRISRRFFVSSTCFPVDFTLDRRVGR